MQRLLIIAPHFPPTNAPDMHRARILAPYLIALGWEVHVLAVTPECVVNERDEWLAAGLPTDLHIHRVWGLGIAWTRVPGLGGLGARSFLALRARARQLLAQRSFAAIFFSTTVIEAMALGPLLRREFGVPYVLDYQDPWTTDQYAINGQRPPGGRIKYWLASKRAKMLEARVVREAGGIVSVSPDYIEQLRSAYSCEGLINSLVAPFPIDAGSVSRISEEHVRQSVFTPGSARHQWVYTGVLIESMRPILNAFFEALSRARASQRMDIEVYFIGTQYGRANIKSPLIARSCARRYGVDSVVSEYPQRIPYSEALACQRDATALLAFGSSDPTYTASKVPTYLASGHPLLTSFHEHSPLKSMALEKAGACATWLPADRSVSRLADAITKKWFEERGYAHSTKIRPAHLAAYLPEKQAGSLSQILHVAAQACSPQSGNRLPERSR